MELRKVTDPGDDLLHQMIMNLSYFMFQHISSCFTGSKNGSVGMKDVP